MDYEKLRRDIHDAEKMIYFATQGKTEASEEIDCLINLIKSCFRVKLIPDRKEGLNEECDETDLGEFYKNLVIMSHILFPVTIKSIMVKEDRDRPWKSGESGFCSSLLGKVKNIFHFAPSLSVVILFASLVLFLTIYFLGYSLVGAGIIERLDGALKERLEIKRVFIEEVQQYKNDNKDFPYKILDDLRSMKMTGIRIEGLINQLKIWNDSSGGRYVFGMYPNDADIKESYTPPTFSNNESQGGKICDFDNKKGNTPVAEGDSGLSGISAVDYQACFQREIVNMPKKDILLKRLEIKNKSLLILTVINNSILLILFGFCGAFAYILRRTVNEIQSYTFEGIRFQTATIRIILGGISGFFLGYLMQNNDLLSLLSVDSGTPGPASGKISLASPLTMAFIGGYSVDILFSIMNRFIYAITNDERYLPASEVMKRKTDVGKLIRNSNTTLPKIG